MVVLPPANGVIMDSTTINAPLPVPSPHSFRLRADATAGQVVMGRGSHAFGETKRALLPRPVRNPPSRRRYGAAGERGEGKGRGARSWFTLHVPPASLRPAISR